MTVNIHENLLVTMGARAAYMECRGDITIPGGSEGEDILAEFVSETVDNYMDAVESNTLGTMGFDEYIERALNEKFGEGNDFSRTLIIEYERFAHEGTTVLSVVDENNDSVLNMLEGEAAEEMYQKLITYVEPEDV